MKHRMLLCALLTIAVSTGAIYSPRAAAAFISTEAMLMTTPPPRSDVRDALRARLVALGVDPGLAQARVDALTEAEAAQLAARLDSLPAGGDAVGAVIFVFLVLLVTDILGYTDVYPFITRTVNGDKCTDHADTMPRPLTHAAR